MVLAGCSFDPQLAKQLQHLFDQISRLGRKISDVWAMLTQFADRQGVPDVSI